MGLQSKLLREDPRLDACLVSDPAHLTLGTQGSFVRKVQRALTILSGAVIQASEMMAGLYGPSTARAVLEYKQVRNIVNKSYQATADNVVGKMTIKSLDDEMLRVERSASPCAHCGDPVSGGGGGSGFRAVKRDMARRAFPAADPVAKNANAVAYALPDVLNIFWQISSIAAERNGRRLNDQVEACNNVFSDLIIVPRRNLQITPAFDYTMTVDVRARSDIYALRIAAGKDQPTGLELRVIVHCFEPSSPEFGFTDWGEYDGHHYSPFVVLNANKERGDKLTLLHEMIHATKLLVHDDIVDPDSVPDATSVFSSNENRNHIRDDHVKRLKSMRWCTPYPMIF